jgi:hypothetical protein
MTKLDWCGDFRQAWMTREPESDSEFVAVVACRSYDFEGLNVASSTSASEHLDLRLRVKQWPAPPGPL